MRVLVRSGHIFLRQADCRSGDTRNMIQVVVRVPHIVTVHYCTCWHVRATQLRTGRRRSLEVDGPGRRRADLVAENSSLCQAPPITMMMWVSSTYVYFPANVENGTAVI